MRVNIPKGRARRDARLPGSAMRKNYALDLQLLRSQFNVLTRFDHRGCHTHLSLCGSFVLYEMVHRGDIKGCFEHRP